MSARGGLLSEIRAQPILAAFLVVWGIEAYMNALYGYRRAGGGAGALGYASVFVAIAFIAAWLPTRLGYIAGHSLAAWATRCLFIGLSGVCFLLSCIAGSSIMGVSLADGGAARQDRAEQHSTVRERLDQARADRKALGTQPSPEQVQARIDAELDTYVRPEGKTIRQLSNGCRNMAEAPNACGRVAKIVVELKAAQRAADLDRLIQESRKALERTEAVAEGQPDLALIARISGLTEHDAGQMWTVALVVIIEIFSNFGWSIVSLGAGAPANPATNARISYHTSQIPLAALGSLTPLNPARAAPQPDEHAGLPPSSLPPQAEAHPAIAYATPAPDRPVDRSQLRELLDGLLVFRAHALADQPGALLHFDEVYAAYQHFAGSRAVAPEAFHTMFPAATGVARVEFGGVGHYADVALTQPKEV